MKKVIGRCVIVVAVVVVVLGVIWHQDSYDKMAELREDFADEVEIAASTSRISLASEIRELRDVSDELEDLSVVPWAVPAKEDLLRGMDQTIRGFLCFQGQGEESEVTRWFERAKMSFDAYAAHRFVR